MPIHATRLWRALQIGHSSVIAFYVSPTTQNAAARTSGTETTRNESNTR
jgi:hypothetical protein